MNKAAAIGLFLALYPAIGQAAETGPEIGTFIPEFELQDQNGQSRTFEDLSGPKGLLLLFHRSADW